MKKKPTGIRKRGKNSWEIKLEIGRHPLTGRRQTRYHSVKGTLKKAEKKRAELITAAAKGGYVDSSRVTVAEFLDRWELDWALHHVGPKSLERYRDLLASYVRPELGGMRMQMVRPANLAALYSKLLSEGRRSVSETRGAGLSPATVRYVHRVLHRAFGHAVMWGLLTSNPCASVEAPKPKPTEVEILTEPQVKEVLAKLRGRPMYLIAAVGLATGMRRGELLALAWRNVDLEGGRVRVERSLEQTKAGLRFKSPKTKHGRRQITLPASIVAELRALRRKQAEQRLGLGLGKEADDALVFRRVDGSPLLPNSLSTEWRRLVGALKLPKVSLHSWRHSHCSQLIASGMDVLTISRRMGHGSPSITLNVYGHLFKSSDDQAATVFEAAFGGTFRE